MFHGFLVFFCYICIVIASLVVDVIYSYRGSCVWLTVSSQSWCHLHHSNWITHDVQSQVLFLYHWSWNNNACRYHNLDHNVFWIPVVLISGKIADIVDDSGTSKRNVPVGKDPFEWQMQYSDPESVQNPQPLSFDVWVKKLQLILHQAFELGMLWGTASSGDSSSGFRRSVPVGDLFHRTCVNQGGTYSDGSNPTTVSDGGSFGWLPNTAVDMT